MAERTAHQPQNNVESRVEDILGGQVVQRSIPEYWDGQTATRIVESVKNLFTPLHQKKADARMLG